MFVDRKGPKQTISNSHKGNLSAGLAYKSNVTEVGAPN